MLKKIIALCLFLAFIIYSPAVSAQDQNLNELNQKADLLKISADLFSKKIDHEKERLHNLELAKKVEVLNSKSNKITNRFAPSSPKETAKDAKSAAKILRETESANRNLRKSNLKILDLEKDLLKIEEKLSKYGYALLFSPR